MPTEMPPTLIASGPIAPGSRLRVSALKISWKLFLQDNGKAECHQKWRKFTFSHHPVQHQTLEKVAKCKHQESDNWQCI